MIKLEEIISLRTTNQLNNRRENAVWIDLCLNKSK